MVSWESIVFNTPNNGIYQWLVTGPKSDDCYIKISDVFQPDEIFGITNKFSITEKEHIMSEIITYQTAHVEQVILLDVNDVPISEPVIQAGDAKISIDGSQFVDLSTLPDNPGEDEIVNVYLSPTESTGKSIIVKLLDVSGTHGWQPLIIKFKTCGNANAYFGFDFNTPSPLQEQLYNNLLLRV